jgi:hypothetical protein
MIVKVTFIINGSRKLSKNHSYCILFGKKMKILNANFIRQNMRGTELN